MKNYAFISYSHKDIQAVRKLHKKIETFPIPRMLRRLSKNAPRRLFPIFRDETDLSGVTLTPKIQEALEASEFLIVVCTKNSADSVWVKREIAAFLEHHSPERIIPVFLNSRTMKEFQKGFPNMLAALDASRGNCVVYHFGKRNPALFEIAARLLQCYSPDLTLKFKNQQDYLRIPAAMLVFICLLIPLTDLHWLYIDHNDIQKYCRDISFAYEWPVPVDPLNEITRRFAEDYYECTYHSNRIVRIRHITSEPSGTALPGSFLLEAETMEFSYNSRSADISKVTFLDSSGQVLFVKNFALDMEIVDLTLAPDSSDPYYLPGDITDPDGEGAAYSCRLAQIYDEAGRIETIWFLTDTYSYHACDNNGYYGITYEYDDSGEAEAVHFIDLEGNILKSYRAE